MMLFSNLSLKHQKKVNERKKEEGAEEGEEGKESEKQKGGRVMTPLKGFPRPPRWVANGTGTPRPFCSQRQRRALGLWASPQRGAGGQGPGHPLGGAWAPWFPVWGVGSPGGGRT